MTKKWAYYNDVDEQKCAWIRELIKAGMVTDGEVDNRPIQSVSPDDLRGFRRVHMFAGIAIWDYALRLAGWPDDRPVWTGSCPCPSFSAAGKGQGFDDPRHLWPNWFGLARECRPPVVFGEQVDDAIGHGWLDLVQTDLEGEAYAVGKAVLGACSVGAPHIRQRLYFVGERADPNARGSQVGWTEGASGMGACVTRRKGTGNIGPEAPQPSDCTCGGSHAADTRHNNPRQHRSGPPLFAARSEQRSEALSGPESMHSERWPLLLNGSEGRDRQDGGRQEAHSEPGTRSEVCSCERADADGQEPSDGDVQRGGEHGLFTTDRGTGERMHPAGLQPEQPSRQGARSDEAEGGRSRGEPSGSGDAGYVRNSEKRGQPVCGCPPGIARYAALTGATRGFWANCDWWYGRDGKYRPIEPKLQPLAYGATARVGRLRGYGDGIVAQAAAAFVSAYLEAERTEETA